MKSRNLIFGALLLVLLSAAAGGELALPRGAVAARADEELSEGVRSMLEWDLQAGSENVTVEARDGTVTLAGAVRSPAQKAAAVRAAGRIYGVKAIADRMGVGGAG